MLVKSGPVVLPFPLNLWQFKQETESFCQTFSPLLGSPEGFFPEAGKATPTVTAVAVTPRRTQRLRELNVPQPPY